MMNLSTRIVLGLGLGILTGIFFGERVEFLEIPGMAFIRLLQMSVIPYIVVSLIMGLGRLTLREVGLLAMRAGSILLVLWALILCVVLLMPFAFPQWESASFFSTSMVQEPLEFNLMSLYIPSNPFYSLANTIVPAWTLVYPSFSVAVPHPDHIRIPMVFASRRGDLEFVETINRWLELHKADGTIDKAFDHWILGRSSKQEAPRWSVIRDVLGWLK